MVCLSRINDGDEGFEEDDWQYQTRELGLIKQAPLRADRWWKDLDWQGDDPSLGSCLCIRCNVWARAQRRREFPIITSSFHHHSIRVIIASLLHDCYIIITFTISTSGLHYYYPLLHSLSLRSLLLGRQAQAATQQWLGSNSRRPKLVSDSKATRAHAASASRPQE